jgi:hypothetical protein
MREYNREDSICKWTLPAMDHAGERIAKAFNAMALVMARRQVR